MEWEKMKDAGKKAKNRGMNHYKPEETIPRRTFLVFYKGNNPSYSFSAMTTPHSCLSLIHI